ncbi:PQ loop repeat-containing protein 2 [Borealophlyctis nickersoniae]|nr:PQ loop repeat-containing protein 2 [Borealophlyctis nickersoniae]
MRLTGAYFCMMSCVCLTQYYWYKKPTSSPSLSSPLEADPLLGPREGGPVNEHAADSEVGLEVEQRKSGYGAIDRRLLGVAVVLCVASSAEGIPVIPMNGWAGLDVQRPLCDAIPELSSMTVTLGSILAWVSGTLYFFSRIPQILENHRNRSTEALSLALFFYTILGNLTYGLSIMLRLPKIDAAFFSSVLPYIIGSIGILVFDLVILGQAVSYGQLRLNELF